MIDVRLLGGFQVVRPDGSIAGPWVRPSARRVFQVLVLREQCRIGREELTEVLFGDLAPEQAARALSKALSMARAALAPLEIINADRDVVWLSGGMRVDAEEQRNALRRAMALPPGGSRDAALGAGLASQGRLLDDELYADWASQAREELEGLRSGARLTLARDRTSGHGRASLWDVVEAWSEVLAHDHASEEACAALVRTYGRAGLSDLAVRTFHRTVAAIHELGLEPSESLRDAYSLALKEAGHAPPSPAVPSVRVRTFGRDAALAELRDLVSDRHRQSSGAVLVTGPAGIGKTHLLETVGRELQAAGWLVAQAAVDRDDRRAPLRALRGVLAQLDLSTAGPLVRLVADGASSEAGADGSADGRRRLLSELVAYFDTLARSRPLAVVIDDVQWADLGLQELLAELVQRRRECHWTVVLAARSDEADTAIALLPEVAHLALVPLSPEGTDALVRHVDPALDANSVAECVHRSGGNPFFVIELARQGVSGARSPAAGREVPGLIIELLDTRLARCSADARRLLSLVALSEEGLSVQNLLCVAAGLGVDRDADAVIRTVDELVGAHLLAERPDGVRLIHPLLRDAAVGRLNPARRAALHGVLADASLGEEAARHRLAAFDASRLREHARPAAEAGFLAGHHARRLFADETASELFAGGLRAFEAASEADRRKLRAGALDGWCQLGDLHQQFEQLADAERAYQAAMALVETDDERARVWSAVASLAYRVGDFEQCVASFERGIAALHPTSLLVRARLEADLGWTYFRLGRAQDAVTTLERAVAALGDLGDGLTRGHALDRLATVLGVVGRAGEGLVVMQRAFEAVGPTGDERELGILHIHRATLYAHEGRFGEALADTAAALRIGAASADRYHLSVVHWVTGSIHEMRNDPATALAEREAELVLLEEIGNARNAAMAHAARARLLCALDRPDESAKAAECARSLADAQRDESFSTQVEQRILTRGATG